MLSFGRGPGTGGQIEFIVLFSALKTTHVIASQCAHWRGNPLRIPEKLGDRHTSGAPRSESKSFMVAGGNHTTIHCGLVRDDILLSKLHHKLQLPVYFITRSASSPP